MRRGTLLFRYRLSSVAGAISPLKHGKSPQSTSSLQVLQYIRVMCGTLLTSHLQLCILSGPNVVCNA